MEPIRHLTASAVVIDPETRHVLLVLHRATGKWMFPGGHVDAGESPAEAAIREVFEETGVVAEHTGDPIELPGAMVWQPSPFITAEIPAPAKPERPGKPAEEAHSHIDLLYVATGNSATPLTAAENEVDGVVWYPILQVRALPVRAEVPFVSRLAYTQTRLRRL